MDLVHLRVQPRERVERTRRFHTRHARDRFERLPRGIPLLVEAPGGGDEGIDRLHTRQGGLHRVLRRHVGAQAGRGQQGDPLEESAGVGLRAGHDQPARPVAGDAIRLGQSVEGEAQEVGGDRRHRDVLGVVEQDAVVDLVGEQQQGVLPGDLGDPVQHLPAVDRTGGVVRIDDHDRLGAVGDLRADVLEVRLPAVLLIAHVVDRVPPAEARHRRPQRVVRRGDQHLVALVEQGLHHHRDELRDAVAEVHVVGIERREPGDLLVAVHHGSSRRHDPATVAVAVRVRDGLDHVADDLIRRVESEDGGVARVELEDRVTLGLEPVGLDERLSADLVQDVLELARLV